MIGRRQPTRRFKVANDENKGLKINASSSTSNVAANTKPAKATIVSSSSTGAVRSALGELSNHVRRGGIESKFGKKVTGDGIEKPAAAVHRRTLSGVVSGIAQRAPLVSRASITARPPVRPPPRSISANATQNAHGAPIRPLPSRVRGTAVAPAPAPVAAPKKQQDVVEVMEVEEEAEVEDEVSLPPQEESESPIKDVQPEPEMVSDEEIEIQEVQDVRQSMQYLEEDLEVDDDDWTFASPASNSRYQAAVEEVRARYKDEIDEFDMTMVSEYSEEIFGYMERLELETMPNANYMDGQAEIAWEMRRTLVDWLLQVHLRYHMLPETLWIAINIIDRFLSRRVVSLVKLQLVGVTAMFLASKYEEIMAPSVDEFSFMTEKTYSRDEILKGEKIILQTLEFNISPYCSPYSWVRRISKADDYDIQTRTLCKLLMEVTLLDHRFLRAKPSLVAAIGMYTSKRMLSGAWDDAFVFYSNYPEEQLIPGFHLLIDNLAERDFSKTFVCKKYANKKFLKASLYARDWALNYVQENVRR